jgi:Phage integrase, N-terminal SAM-like domain
MASIEKRVRADKTTYRVRYRDPAGNQRSKVFGRKADAERWMVDNQHAKLKGAWVDPRAGRLALGPQAERWFASAAALRPTTRRDYRKLLDLEVLPTFGRVALGDIDTLAVREWVAGLVAGGLSAKRARKAYAVLAQVLESAVEGGLLARNAAAGIKLPKVQRKEMLFLSAVQVEALAAAIRAPYGWTSPREVDTGAMRPWSMVAG